MNKFLPLLALAFVLALSACSKEKPKQPEDAPPVAVKTAPVEKKEVPDTISVVGTVESRKEAVVSSKIMGVVLEAGFEEGQHVFKGDKLFVLDSADIKAKEDEAKQAKAEGEAALREADAALVNVKINQGRIDNLYKEGAATKKEADDINSQAKMAEAKVEQVRAKMAQADAVIAQTAVMMGYAVIRSPINGVLVSRMAQAGEMASPGRPLAKVLDDKDLRVVATVKEGALLGLHKGDSVRVEVDALPGADIRGRISEIVPAADPQTRSFTVKVDLPPVIGLLPGMFGRVALETGRRDAVLLPDGSLTDKEGMQGVYVVTADGRAAFQAVKAGDEVAGKVESLSGLSGGERVITGDLSAIRDGMRVTH